MTTPTLVSSFLLISSSFLFLLVFASSSTTFTTAFLTASDFYSSHSDAVTALQPGDNKFRYEVYSSCGTAPECFNRALPTSSSSSSRLAQTASSNVFFNKSNPLHTVEHKCIHDKYIAPQMKKEAEQLRKAYPQGVKFTAADTNAENRKGSSEAVEGIRIAVRSPDLHDTAKYCESSTGESREMKKHLSFLDADLPCDAETQLTSTKRDLLLNVFLPEALDRIKKMIKVTPVTSNLVAPSETCIVHSIPNEDQTTGIANADFVLYVSATPNVPGTVAWAGTCFPVEDTRPHFGRLNISPKYLIHDPNDTFAFNKVINIMIHEIFHALGFNNELILAPKHLHTLPDKRRGKTVTEVQGPKTVEKVREFFGCPTLTGMEIEDQGDSGTAGGHIERRLIENALMQGNTPNSIAIDPISLAIMDDSPWYTADFSTVDEIVWGNNKYHGKGCNFVYDLANSESAGVGDWCDGTAARRPCPFCRNSTIVLSQHLQTYSNNGSMCTSDLLAIGSCDYQRHPEPISPSHFQNYPDKPNMGGTIKLMDYASHVWHNRFCNDPTTPNRDSAIRRNENEIGGDTFKRNSRCVQTQSFSKLGYTSTTPRAACIEIRCPGGTRVEMRVRDDVWMTCPMNGMHGNIEATGKYKGTIYCPAARDICTPELHSPDVSAPTTKTPPSTNGVCLNYEKAKEALLRLSAEVSGGEEYDKWCTDLTEKVMIAAGLPATHDRRAKEQAEILRERGWKSKTWSGSADDFSVLFWAKGSCSSFMGNNHVAMVYKNRRYQWNPSRAGSGVTWSDCVPEVLTYPGCVTAPGDVSPATPAPPTNSPPFFGSVPSPLVCHDGATSCPAHPSLPKCPSSTSLQGVRSIVVGYLQAFGKAMYQLTGEQFDLAITGGTESYPHESAYRETCDDVRLYKTFDPDTVMLSEYCNTATSHICGNKLKTRYSETVASWKAILEYSATASSITNLKHHQATTHYWSRNQQYDLAFLHRVETPGGKFIEAKWIEATYGTDQCATHFDVLFREVSEIELPQSSASDDNTGGSLLQPTAISNRFMAKRAACRAERLSVASSGFFVKKECDRLCKNSPYAAALDYESCCNAVFTRLVLRAGGIILPVQDPQTFLVEFGDNYADIVAESIKAPGDFLIYARRGTPFVRVGVVGAGGASFFGAEGTSLDASQWTLSKVLRVNEKKFEVCHFEKPADGISPWARTAVHLTNNRIVTTAGNPINFGRSILAAPKYATFNVHHMNSINIHRAASNRMAIREIHDPLVEPQLRSEDFVKYPTPFSIDNAGYPLAACLDPNIAIALNALTESIPASNPKRFIRVSALATRSEYFAGNNALLSGRAFAIDMYAGRLISRLQRDELVRLVEILKSALPANTQGKFHVRHRLLDRSQIDDTLFVEFDEKVSPTDPAGPWLDHRKAKESLLRLSSDSSGRQGSTQRLGADFVERVLIAAGMPPTNFREAEALPKRVSSRQSDQRSAEKLSDDFVDEQSLASGQSHAEKQFNILRSRTGWFSYTWNHKIRAPDFTIAFWNKDNACSKKADIGLIFDNRIYKWDPSVRGQGISLCVPDNFLTWTGATKNDPNEQAVVSAEVQQQKAAAAKSTLLRCQFFADYFARAGCKYGQKITDVCIDLIDNVAAFKSSSFALVPHVKPDRLLLKKIVDKLFDKLEAALESNKDIQKQLHVACNPSKLATIVAKVLADGLQDAFGDVIREAELTVKDMKRIASNFDKVLNAIVNGDFKQNDAFVAVECMTFVAGFTGIVEGKVAEKIMNVAQNPLNQLRGKVTEYADKATNVVDVYKERKNALVNNLQSKLDNLDDLREKLDDALSSVSSVSAESVAQFSTDLLEEEVSNVALQNCLAAADRLKYNKREALALLRARRDELRADRDKLAAEIADEVNKLAASSKLSTTQDEYFAALNETLSKEISFVNAQNRYATLKENYRFDAERLREEVNRTKVHEDELRENLDRTWNETRTAYPSLFNRRLTISHELHEHYLKPLQDSRAFTLAEKEAKKRNFSIPLLEKREVLDNCTICRHPDFSNEELELSELCKNNISAANCENDTRQTACIEPNCTSEEITVLEDEVRRLEDELHSFSLQVDGEYKETLQHLDEQLQQAREVYSRELLRFNDEIDRNITALAEKLNITRLEEEVFNASEALDDAASRLNTVRAELQDTIFREDSEISQLRDDLVKAEEFSNKALDEYNAALKEAGGYLASLVSRLDVTDEALQSVVDALDPNAIFNLENMCKYLDNKVSETVEQLGTLVEQGTNIILDDADYNTKISTLRQLVDGAETALDTADRLLSDFTRFGDAVFNTAQDGINAVEDQANGLLDTIENEIRDKVFDQAFAKIGFEAAVRGLNDGMKMRGRVEQMKLFSSGKVFEMFEQSFCRHMNCFESLGQAVKNEIAKTKISSKRDAVAQGVVAGENGLVQLADEHLTAFEQKHENSGKFVKKALSKIKSLILKKLSEIVLPLFKAPPPAPQINAAKFATEAARSAIGDTRYQVALSTSGGGIADANHQCITNIGSSTRFRDFVNARSKMIFDSVFEDFPAISMVIGVIQEGIDWNTFKTLPSLLFVEWTMSAENIETVYKQLTNVLHELARRVDADCGMELFADVRIAVVESIDKLKNCPDENYEPENCPASLRTRQYNEIAAILLSSIVLRNSEMALTFAANDNLIGYITESVARLVGVSSKSSAVSEGRSITSSSKASEQRSATSQQYSETAAVPLRQFVHPHRRLGHLSHQAVMNATAAHLQPARVYEHIWTLPNGTRGESASINMTVTICLASVGVPRSRNPTSTWHVHIDVLGDRRVGEPGMTDKESRRLREEILKKYGKRHAASSSSVSAEVEFLVHENTTSGAITHVTSRASDSTFVEGMLLLLGQETFRQWPQHIFTNLKTSFDQKSNDSNRIHVHRFFNQTELSDYGDLPAESHHEYEVDNVTGEIIRSHNVLKVRGVVDPRNGFETVATTSLRLLHTLPFDPLGVCSTHLHNSHALKMHRDPEAAKEAHHAHFQRTASAQEKESAKNDNKKCGKKSAPPAKTRAVTQLYDDECPTLFDVATFDQAVQPNMFLLRRCFAHGPEQKKRLLANIHHLVADPKLCGASCIGRLMEVLAITGSSSRHEELCDLYTNNPRFSSGDKEAVQAFVGLASFYEDSSPCLRHCVAHAAQLHRIKFQYVEMADDGMTPKEYHRRQQQNAKNKRNKKKTSSRFNNSTDSTLANRFASAQEQEERNSRNARIQEVSSHTDTSTQSTAFDFASVTARKLGRTLSLGKSKLFLGRIAAQMGGACELDENDQPLSCFIFAFARADAVIFGKRLPIFNMRYAGNGEPVSSGGDSGASVGGDVAKENSAALKGNQEKDSSTSTRCPFDKKFGESFSKGVSLPLLTIGIISFRVGVDVGLSINADIKICWIPSRLLAFGAGGDGFVALWLDGGLGTPCALYLYVRVVIDLIRVEAGFRFGIGFTFPGLKFKQNLERILEFSAFQFSLSAGLQIGIPFPFKDICLDFNFPLPLPFGKTDPPSNPNAAVESNSPPAPQLLYDPQPGIRPVKTDSEQFWAADDFSMQYPVRIHHSPQLCNLLIGEEVFQTVSGCAAGQQPRFFIPARTLTAGYYAGSLCIDKFCTSVALRAHAYYGSCDIQNMVDVGQYVSCTAPGIPNANCDLLFMSDTSRSSGFMFPGNPSGPGAFTTFVPGSLRSGEYALDIECDSVSGDRVRPTPKKGTPNPPLQLTVEASPIINDMTPLRLPQNFETSLYIRAAEGWPQAGDIQCEVVMNDRQFFNPRLLYPAAFNTNQQYPDYYECQGFKVPEICDLVNNRCYLRLVFNGVDDAPIPVPLQSYTTIRVGVQGRTRLFYDIDRANAITEATLQLSPNVFLPELLVGRLNRCSFLPRGITLKTIDNPLNPRIIPCQVTKPPGASLHVLKYNIASIKPGQYYLAIANNDPTSNIKTQPIEMTVIDLRRADNATVNPAKPLRLIIDPFIKDEIFFGVWADGRFLREGVVEEASCRGSPATCDVKIPPFPLRPPTDHRLLVKSSVFLPSDNIDSHLDFYPVNYSNPNGCTPGCGSELYSFCQAHNGLCVCGKDGFIVPCSLVACPNNCNRRGGCNASSLTCLCNHGFYGADCGQQFASPTTDLSPTSAAPVVPLAPTWIPVDFPEISETKGLVRCIFYPTGTRPNAATYYSEARVQEREDQQQVISCLSPKLRNAALEPIVGERYDYDIELPSSLQFCLGTSVGVPHCIKRPKTLHIVDLTEPVTNAYFVGNSKMTFEVTSSFNPGFVVKSCRFDSLSASATPATKVSGPVSTSSDSLHVHTTTWSCASPKGQLTYTTPLYVDVVTALDANVDQPSPASTAMTIRLSPDLTFVPVPCPVSPDDNVPCSGRGNCELHGVCNCDTNFTGDYCQFTKCKNSCSGHGECTYPEPEDLSIAVCRCNEAWNVDNESCNVPSFCDAEATCPIASIGNGVCDPACRNADEASCKQDDGDCNLCNCVPELLEPPFCAVTCLGVGCQIPDFNPQCEIGVLKVECPVWMPSAIRDFCQQVAGDEICHEFCAPCGGEGSDCLGRVELDNECSPGCTDTLLRNNVCNAVCATPMCNFDAAAGEKGRCSDRMIEQNSQVRTESRCAPDCTEEMLSNNEKDPECNSPNCDFDNFSFVCAAGCQPFMRENSRCDPECNTANCEFDNGMCSECAPGCVRSMINDGNCDPDCLSSPSCSYDGVDCGDPCRYTSCNSGDEVCVIVNLKPTCIDLSTVANQSCPDRPCPANEICINGNTCKCLGESSTRIDGVCTNYSLLTSFIENSCSGDGAFVGNDGTSLVCKCRPGFVESPSSSSSSSFCVSEKFCDDPAKNDCNLDNTKCVDVQGSYYCDPLEEIPQNQTLLMHASLCNCSEGEMCVTSGDDNRGFKCVCFYEFERDPVTNKCFRNYCSNTSCPIGAECINEDSYAKCVCPNGTTAVNNLADQTRECAPISPCTANISICGLASTIAQKSVCLHRFVNETVPTYTCSCKPPFELVVPPNFLIDFDPSRESSSASNDDFRISTEVTAPVCLRAKCFSDDNGTRDESAACRVCDSRYERITSDNKCVCAKPSQLLPDGSCSPLPPCYPGCSVNQTCNLQDNVCRCKPGFVNTTIPGQNGKFITICEDENECETDTASCAKHVKCINTIGSWKCGCPEGYLGTNETGCCRCSSMNLCRPLTPKEISNDIMPQDELVCKICEPNTEFSRYDAATGACISRVPRCNRPCPLNARCHSTEIASRCVCNPGYLEYGSNDQGIPFCRRINRCEEQDPRTKPICAPGLNCTDEGDPATSRPKCKLMNKPKNICDCIPDLKHGQILCDPITSLLSCSNPRQQLVWPVERECANDDGLSQQRECQCNIYSQVTCRDADYDSLFDRTDPSFNVTPSPDALFMTPDSFCNTSSQCASDLKCVNNSCSCPFGSTWNDFSSKCVSKVGALSCVGHPELHCPANHICIINQTHVDLLEATNASSSPNTDTELLHSCVLNPCVQYSVNCGEDGKCRWYQHPTRPTTLLSTCVCSGDSELNAATGACYTPTFCDRFSNQCGANTFCANDPLNPQSGSCHCHIGFEPRPDNFRACQNINECTVPLSHPAHMTCGSHATCVDTHGSVYCECDEGYEKIAGEGDIACRQTDYCHQGQPCGTFMDYTTNPNFPVQVARGLCTVIDGGYTCGECRPGFRFVRNSSDPFDYTVGTCEDINECSLNLHSCPANSVCENTIGSHRCNCKPGYTDGGSSGTTGATSCQLIDICASLPSDVCGAQAYCQNGVNSFKCICVVPGQRFYNFSNTLVCAPQTCDPVAVCYGRGVCDETGTCECEDSFHGDRCQLCAPGRCGPHGRCDEADPANLGCLCDAGFTGEFCDVCDAIQLCNGHGQCSNDGSCDCEYGYWGDRCENTCNSDVHGICGGAGNICDKKTGKCHCVRDGTSFENSADGRMCLDIDECEDENVCGPRAQCFDFHGFKNCSCLEGFTKTDSGVCVDIRECSHPDLNNCEWKDYCVEESPGYRCTCPSGHYLRSDNATCQDVPECSNGLKTPSPEHCDEDDFSQECLGVVGHNCQINSTNCTGDEDGKFMCECITGDRWFDGFTNMTYNYTSHTHFCHDIDECEDPWWIDLNGGLACGAPQPGIKECKNTLGSFYCACDHGFVYDADQKLCVDFDECANDGAIRYHDCGFNRSWTNTRCKNLDALSGEGYFTCECIPGYRKNLTASIPDPNSNRPQDLQGSCLDIDECTDTDWIAANGPACGNDPNAFCVNTIGGFECRCKGFWKGETTCLDTSYNKHYCSKTSIEGTVASSGVCIDYRECTLDIVNGKNPCVLANYHYCNERIGAAPQCTCKQGEGGIYAEYTAGGCDVWTSIHNNIASNYAWNSIRVAVINIENANDGTGPGVAGGCDIPLVKQSHAMVPGISNLPGIYHKYGNDYIWDSLQTVNMATAEQVCTRYLYGGAAHLLWWDTAAEYDYFARQIIQGTVVWNGMRVGNQGPWHFSGNNFEGVPWRATSYIDWGPNEPRYLVACSVSGWFWPNSIGARAADCGVNYLYRTLCRFNPPCEYRPTAPFLVRLTNLGRSVAQAIRLSFYQATIRIFHHQSTYETVRGTSVFRAVYHCSHGPYANQLRFAPISSRVYGSTGPYQSITLHTSPLVGELIPIQTPNDEAVCGAGGRVYTIQITVNQGYGLEVLEGTVRVGLNGQDVPLLLP